jgi:peptidoglycan/xylan/chitin deacetylase (PgdA/CDA1 family)
MLIRNFLFHRVSDEADAMWPPMKPDLFERIISTLAKNYSVVPLENYLDDPGAFNTKRKIATVLFDDGYKDNIEVAAPILSKYKCPASFYVVTDCIDRNIPTWTYIVDNVFAKTRKEKIELGYDFVPEKFRVIRLVPSSPLVKEVKPWLKKLSNPQRLMALESIFQQCDDVPAPQGKMMNWDEVRQLANNGFVIGSHSHTHPMLASLQNENEISNELKMSSKKIETELGSFPKAISYPIGSFDNRVVTIAKKQGYKYGLAVEQQFYKSSTDDLYKIPRVELYQEPWWKVQMRMKGIYSAIKKIKK